MLELSDQLKEYAQFFTDDKVDALEDEKKLVKFAQPCEGINLPQYSRHRSKII